MDKKEIANNIADGVMKAMDEQILKAMYGVNDISQVKHGVDFGTGDSVGVITEFTIGKLYYMWAETNGYNIDYKPTKFLWIHPEDLKEILKKEEVIMFPDMAGIVYSDIIQRGNIYIIENNENQIINNKLIKELKNDEHICSSNFYDIHICRS